MRRKRLFQGLLERTQVFYYGVLHTGRWRYCSANCTYYQVPWVS